MANQVFISYSTKDTHQMQKVHGIVVSLSSPSAVFVDRYSIQPGSKWEESIIEKIAASETFFVLWSPKSAKSDWVRREILIALSLNSASGKPKIVPLVFDNHPLKFGLDAYQSVDMGSDNERNYLQYVQSAIGILLVAVPMVALTLYHSRLLTGAVLVLFTWLFVVSFSGLRNSAAPWANGDSEEISLAFGTITVSRFLASLVMVLSGFVCCYMALLLLYLRQI